MSQNLTTNSNNKYNWKNFYECLENIIKLFDALTSNIERQNIIDKCEKALESDVITKRGTFEKINRQLNNISLLKKKLDKIYKYATLNWIACYNDKY